MKEKMFEELVEKCEKMYSGEEILNIKKAYEFASEKHKGKIRLNKTDYMTHPLGVALILLDLDVDSITITAALIHETINHAKATKEEIENLFGSEVANIVDVISK